MLKIVCLCMFLVLVGCASTTTQPNTTPKANINFIDMEVFDTDLSNAMTSHLSPITITPLAPINVNDMPERLGKWLTAVRERGGKIDIEPKTKSLVSLVSFLFSSLTVYSDFFKKKSMYDTAVNYNVVMLYKPNSGKIENIKFMKK